MSYVADSTDVEFSVENQTSTTTPAESDQTSGGWGTAGASPSHDHEGEEEEPYATPYETFNVDIESEEEEEDEQTHQTQNVFALECSSRLTYTQAMDNSADTMAAVYGSSEMEQASGNAQGVYAPYQAGAPEAVEGESEDDSDSEEEDQPVIRQRCQTKNWNEQFQRLLSLEPSAHKFAEMARLAHDFVFAAETYGKIIISELGLHESKKTIKPIAVGGQAGGEKYIVQGIFFKFATDIFGIYGGDEYAMKAASHDLKGLIHYYSCQIPGLHVPLMALIDYLGFRLIAITILPINAGTLRYGSCDAGVTIHCEDPTLNAMMKQAARKMHLRGHYVGTPEGLGKKIYGPVDIEAHKGTDDRYYVVDFARTFPPERPDAANVGRKGIILYNLLRPELVKSNKVPLSSDAYTIWARADSKKDLYNLQVTEATERLFKEVIPQVAARLNELQESADKGKTHLDLIEVLHSAGVNVRHLGKVRQLVDPKLQQTTLIEACLPLSKQIAEKFRKKTRAMGLPTEEPQKMAAVKHLNKLLGRHRNSNYYWRTLKRSLIKKFSNCLLAHELAAGYDLRQSMDIIKFFDRLRALSPNTIPLTEEAAKDFGRAIQDNAKKSWGEWVPNFKFLLSDMTALHATVKHMNLIDIAEASAMFYEGLEEKGYDQTRLLIQGMGKFQIASRKMPFLNVDTIILLGDMLVAQAANSTDRVAVSLILSNALIAYQTALNIQPSNTKCIIGVGNIHARREQWADAIATYKHAIEVDPTSALAYLQLAKVYKGKGALTSAAIAAAEECLRKAVAIDPNYYEALLMLAELIISSTYLKIVDNNVSEVDETMRQTLAEVGGMYQSALSFRANDDAAYDFVDKMIVHVVDPNPKAYKWFDLSLALLWHVVEASPAFNNLVSGKLANVDALHFRHCKRVLTDPIFRGIAWASPAIHTLVLEANETVTEETMLAWLDHHSVPLREFSLKGCTTQFSSALLLKLASLPRHANALETLRLPGLAVTREALLASFGGRATKPAGAAEEVVAGEADTSAEAAAQEGDADAAKNSRWSRLATLDISQIPEVDDAVIVEVARLPALTALEYSGATAVTSAALEHLPSQLTSVSFGGAVSLSGLTALVKRCSGITRLSLKGVTGLPAEDAFKLAPLLPALTHYQIPTGNVYLYSGTKSFEVMYSDRGTIRFHIPNGPELYQLRTQHQTVMEGPDGFSLTLSNMPHNKMIADKGTVIARASFAPAIGWNVATVVGGLSTVSLIQYQQMTRSYVVQPRLVDVTYQPQLGQAKLYIRPGTNITLLLALFGIAFAVK